MTMISKYRTSLPANRLSIKLNSPLSYQRKKGDTKRTLEEDGAGF